MNNPASAIPELPAPGAPEPALRGFLHRLRPVVDSEAEAEAAHLATRSIRRPSRLWAIDLCISAVDLTGPADTPGKVRALCATARQPDPDDPDAPAVAAVCVDSDLVDVAARATAGSPVRVASLPPAFPAGRDTLDARLEDARSAIDKGADEVDLTLDHGAFLAGRYARASEEVLALRDACGPAGLTVVLDVGELGDLSHLRRAAWLAMLAGADALRVASAPIRPGAALAHMLVLLEAARAFEAATGRGVGVKAANGFGAARDAIRCLVLVNETAGPAWLTPDRLRFSAPDLLIDLVAQRRQQGGDEPATA